jgi:hypothetical protein
VIAIPIALVLAGYWVLYAGVKQVTLGDAFACAAQVQQTPVSEAQRAVTGGALGAVLTTPQGRAAATGGIVAALRECKPRQGDLRLPGGLLYRPYAPGTLGFLGGIVLRSC